MRKNNGKFIACEICGKMKYFDGYQVKRNKHFYCSKDCFGHGHSKSKVRLTKEFLIEEYVNKQKSMKLIAKEIGCVKRTISDRLTQYNIEIRRKNCRKIVHCDMCGKELWKYEYDLKKFKHFFCSNECYKKHLSLSFP